MDECQKYAEQYSTAVKVRRLVPCIRFHVQVFRGVFPQCSFEAFMGHSVCVEKWNREYSLSLTVNSSWKPESCDNPWFFTSLSVSHTCTACPHPHVHQEKMQLSSPSFCFTYPFLPLPLQVLLEHPPLVWVRVPCEDCCRIPWKYWWSVPGNIAGVSMQILLWHSMEEHLP